MFNVFVGVIVFGLGNHFVFNVCVGFLVLGHWKSCVCCCLLWSGLGKRVFVNVCLFVPWVWLWKTLVVQFTCVVQGSGIGKHCGFPYSAVFSCALARETFCVQCMFGFSCVRALTNMCFSVCCCVSPCSGIGKH